jgi:hypothetical protein
MNRTTNKTSNIVSFSKYLNRKRDDIQQDNYTAPNISRIVNMLHKNMDTCKHLKTKEMYNIFLTLWLAMQDFENQRENLLEIYDVCEGVYNSIDLKKKKIKLSEVEF